MASLRWPVLLLLTLTRVHAQQQPGFTVRDSIEMTRFSDPSARDPGSHAKYAPDGQSFFVITSRGVIRSNSVESTLWLYRTEDVRRALASAGRITPIRRTLVVNTVVPEVIATAPYQSMILDAQWAPDSKTIYFLAQDEKGNRRLTSVDTIHGRSRVLTPSGHDVYRYALGSRCILYGAIRRSNKPTSSRPVVTGVPLDDLVLRDEKFALASRQIWIFYLDSGKLKHLTALDEEQHFTAGTESDAFSLSPDDTHAALLVPVRQVEAGWEHYRTARGFEQQKIDGGDPRRASSAELNFNRLVEFAVVSLSTGMIDRLHAPSARQLGYFNPSHAFWSKDGQSVLFTNTFLPLGDSHEKAEFRPCAAALFRWETDSISCLAVIGQSDALSDAIGGAQVLDAELSKNPNSVSLLVADASNDRELRRYRFVQEAWQLVDIRKVDTQTASDLRHRGHVSRDQPIIRIQQSLNAPPLLQAEYAGRSVSLWDPNPYLKTLGLGDVTAIHWTDKHGRQWSGGLVKPPDFQEAHRYPLVIQMYQFHPHEFMTDGMATTAMAARPLASAGMMFLQITKQSHTFDQAELEVQLQGILSSIKFLDREGLIDSTRVGLIGYSASCPYVEYALIHSPSSFKAATLADGIDYGYLQALLWGPSNTGLREQFSRVNGSAPFGEGLPMWLERSPNFHLDKVTTPLRIEAIRPASLLSEWEIYSSLYQQRKPVELIYLSDGQHILQKPQDRLISQQGNVDWFRFWLLNEKNPAPHDEGQYLRWQQLKK